MQDADCSNEFGRLLQKFRLRAGLTQEALAEKAGLGRRSIQSLERSESGPQRATVERLAQALALSHSERTRFEVAAHPSPRHRLTNAPQPTRLLTGTRSKAIPHHNLPAQLTSFVGREEEIREIRLLLATKRLVTLTGAGGCGKTRLAQQVAAEVLASYPNGVWLVELATLRNPALVPQTIARTLGLPERPGQPVLTVLTSFFQKRHALLVLDNCEHLIDVCARVTASLLQECPQLTILATSRQPLHVLGEVQWHVPSLSTPDPTNPAASLDDHPDFMSRYPAIQLFVDRAQAVQPTFVLSSQNLRTVIQICWRLDGLPLAIELAAARVRGLSVESIADRLDRRFQLLTTGSRVALPRLQTLRATIDWSYDLLAEPERILFRRLAVFAGGFTLEAAEGICAGDILASADVLPVLLRLVDQSLIEAVGGGEITRYRILETIGEYARERLIAADEADLLQRKHSAWYLAWAKEAEAHIWGPEQRVWLDRLEREHDNLRAALHDYAWRDVTSGLCLAAYLHRFWVDRGHLVEGQRWLEDLLGQGGGDMRTRGVASAALGRLRMARGNLTGAISALEEGLALLRSDGQSRDLAYALHWLGAAVLAAGNDDTRTQQLFEESVETARATGNLNQQGASVGYLGNLAFVQGDLQKARERYLEGLSLERQAGALRGIGWLLRCLAILARSEGDRRRAWELLAESLALSREVGHGVGIAGALTSLAILAEQDGEHRRAVRLLAAVSRDSLPVPARRIEGADWEASLATCRDSIGEEAFAKAWAEGQAMSLDQVVRYALGDSSE